LPNCQFTTIYYDYDNRKEVDFYCDEEPLASGFCIFHDKDYLQDKTNNEEHKRVVLDRLKRKVKHAISNNEPLLCLGFQLPDFNLSDFCPQNDEVDNNNNNDDNFTISEYIEQEDKSISNEFTKPVYFSGSQFFGKADFSRALLKGGVDFIEAKFQAQGVVNEFSFEFQSFTQ
jgi:hypothetical protein